MTQTDPDAARVRPFADFLREQAKGKTHEELGESLQQLVRRVAETGRKGSIQLTVTVEPMPKAGDGQLMISDQIKLRLPEFDRQASIFFSDTDGNLQRDDPNQMTFDSLREVPSPTGAQVLRDGAGHMTVDPVTGEVTGVTITKEQHA